MSRQEFDENANIRHKNKSILVLPRIYSNNEGWIFQISVHSTAFSKTFLRELGYIFNFQNIQKNGDLLEDANHEIYAIPIMQKSTLDLVRIGEDIENEKEGHLLKVTLRFSQMFNHLFFFSLTHPNGYLLFL